MPSNTQQQIDMLRQQVEALQGEVFRNNFVSSQDFNKSVRFNSVLRVPTLASAPTQCEIGEVYVNSGNGKLYVCSTTNTWTAQT